jgi:hypothetical protein
MDRAAARGADRNTQPRRPQQLARANDRQARDAARTKAPRSLSLRRAKGRVLELSPIFGDGLKDLAAAVWD